MTAMVPWNLYRLLGQDSSLRRQIQLQVANSTLATTASAIELHNSIAARHIAASGTEHRAARLDSANRPRALNKLELAVEQMLAEPAIVSEIERLLGCRLDNSTRRLKRKRESKPSS